MSIVSNKVAEFIQNRARFSAEQLRNYLDQWVAFSSDGLRIVASSEDLAKLDQLVRESGVDPEDVFFEKIVSPESQLGGAELH